MGRCRCQPGYTETADSQSYLTAICRPAGGKDSLTACQSDRQTDPIICRHAEGKDLYWLRAGQCNQTTDLMAELDSVVLKFIRSELTNVMIE